MGKKDIKIKKPTTEFIEIRDGELYLKIPKDMDLENVVKMLLVYKKKEPELEEPEKPKEEEINVAVEPQLNEFMTNCPKCNSKVKSKVRKRGHELIRIVRCKKSKGLRKKCDFVHEFSIKV